MGCCSSKYDFSGDKPAAPKETSVETLGMSCSHEGPFKHRDDKLKANEEKPEVILKGELQEFQTIDLNS